MVSTQFLTGVLALLAANAVSAGPCKLSPSSSTVYTTTTVETATTETSSATVSESFTETFTSLGLTETINSLSTSAETSTALGTSTTLLTTTTEETISSVAAECTTNADCDGAAPFCDAGTCIATDPNLECSTNTECSILHGSDAPFYSAAGNCIGCRGDGDCYGETPYCDNDFCNDVVGHGVSRL